jgi:hypothetical protein
MGSYEAEHETITEAEMDDTAHRGRFRATVVRSAQD